MIGFENERKSTCPLQPVSISPSHQSDQYSTFEIVGTFELKQLPNLNPSPDTSHDLTRVRYGHMYHSLQDS